MPIKIYKAVQTGENIQLGGLNAGLFSAEYHVETDDTVKTEPIMPANRHIRIEITNFQNFSLAILLTKIYEYINSLSLRKKSGVEEILRSKIPEVCARRKANRISPGFFRKKKGWG
jgi:hypothetical protein